MEIGDHIGFIHQGKLVWEGSNKEIMNSDCQPLNDFVFANNLARQLKKNSL
jgi:phospholipid/cholesterol/gamma-HCH transport system ATP-binding protein